MSFRLVAKLVTLNYLERRNGVILRYFSEFGYLPGVLRKSSRLLSHLLMSSCCILVNLAFSSLNLITHITLCVTGMKTLEIDVLR